MLNPHCLLCLVWGIFQIWNENIKYNNQEDWGTHRVASLFLSFSLLPPQTFLALSGKTLPWFTLMTLPRALKGEPEAKLVVQVVRVGLGLHGSLDVLQSRHVLPLFEICSWPWYLCNNSTWLGILYSSKHLLAKAIASSFELVGAQRTACEIAQFSQSSWKMRQTPEQTGLVSRSLLHT